MQLTIHNNIIPFAGSGPNQPPQHYQSHYTHPQQVQVANNHTHNTQPSPYTTHPSQMQHNNHTHMLNQPLINTTYDELRKYVPQLLKINKSLQRAKTTIGT
eukprot:216364_1